MPRGLRWLTRRRLRATPRLPAALVSLDSAHRPARLEPPRHGRPTARRGSDACLRAPCPTPPRETSAAARRLLCSDGREPEESDRVRASRRVRPDVCAAVNAAGRRGRTGERGRSAQAASRVAAQRRRASRSPQPVPPGWPRPRAAESAPSRRSRVPARPGGTKPDARPGGTEPSVIHGATKPTVRCANGAARDVSQAEPHQEPPCVSFRCCS